MAPGDASVLEAPSARGSNSRTLAGPVSAQPARALHCGKGEHDAQHCLAPWELDAGFILCCQARPTTGTLELTTTRNDRYGFWEFHDVIRNHSLRRRQGIARLTLNRPDKLNSFNTVMHTEVRHALERLPAAGARVLVLTGAGRGFCAGQDLGDRAVAPGDQGIDLGESIEKYYKPLVLALSSLPMPVIAAVNGVAAGAGANIALACDLVIAARSGEFRAGVLEARLVPDSGGTWSLPRLVGNARALGLTLLETSCPPSRLRHGNDLAMRDDAELESTVKMLAEHFADAPTRGLAATKARSAIAGDTLSTSNSTSSGHAARTGRSADYAEGVAAFAGKRTRIFWGVDHEHTAAG